MKILFMIFTIVGLSALPAAATIVTYPVEYSQGGTKLIGYMAHDDAVSGKRPGVLVVHEWWGLNDHAKMRAEALAAMGYVAFAIDMYGEGLTTRDPKEASRLSGHLRSTPLMRERALAGLEMLKRNDLVDRSRLAAIGFCFGGTTVLELAYTGADLKAVVTFHGGLTDPKPEDMGKVRAKILVLHGAEDPYVKPEAISSFQSTMAQAGVDWQMISYGGTVHSFTNPGAGTDPSKGLAYNPVAAERSWRHMAVFFEEVL